jgi:hypothetical protein
LNNRFRPGPGWLLAPSVTIAFPLLDRGQGLILKRVIIIIEFDTTAEAEHTDHHDEQTPYWADELQDMLDDYN